MAAFSQLATFAKGYRQRPSPGVEIVVTPHYQLQLMPDFPIPGPNNVSWIRCTEAEADDVIEEVRAAAAARGLPLSWILDPDAQPPDLADRLAGHGIVPEPGDDRVSVMVLRADSELYMPTIEGLALRDGLAGIDSFTAAEQVAAEAFGDVAFGAPSPIDAQRDRRFANNRAAGNRHIVLATIDGEPAGSGALTVLAPDAAIINGGAVRPRFRGRGVYRALVVERLKIARDAGAAGLIVWGGHMSGPILAGLGFETVSWRRFYVTAAGGP
jgi:GNAT superfamily N-acetyltransferase